MEQSFKLDSVFCSVHQGDDLFKNDPFKSDLPASGESNGTGSGIANGELIA